MSEINTLFTNYSVEELIIVILVSLFVAKVLLELWRYFYDKARDYFGMKNKKQTWQDDTTQSLKTIVIKIDELQAEVQENTERLTKVEEKVSQLEQYSQTTHEHQKELEYQMKVVQERLQENTRSFLIDAHHRFKYEVEGIDDLNLQSLERRYLFYKTAGGNSFIDDLMKEVRELPRINYMTAKTSQPHDGREIHGY